jgi:hypothetical protein
MAAFSKAGEESGSRGHCSVNGFRTKQSHCHCLPYTSSDGGNVAGAALRTVPARICEKSDGAIADFLDPDRQIKAISYNRLWKTIMLWNVEGLILSRTSAHRWR